MEDIVDTLKKMRISDCQQEKSDSGAVKLTVNVQVGKKSESNEDDEKGFSATAVISCAPDYPESCASVQIVSSSGLSSEAVNEMTKRVNEVAIEKKGEECVPLLVRIVRRYLLDQRVHECPACKADLLGGQSDSWRSHCGHFYHRACIISLIQTSARAQQENRPEGGDDEQQAQAAERRPVCPACGLYEFTLRDDKPISRRINKPGSGGGRFRGRRGRNQHSAGEGEAGEGEAGQGDQRRRRPRRIRNRRGGPAGGGDNDEPAGGEGEGEAEGDAAPGQRRQRKRNPNRRRRQQQRSGGEGDGDAEAGGDDPKVFNQRRQADMRFNEFEQFRNQVGSGNAKGGGRRRGGGGGGGYQGDFPQPGYVDENGGFYAPDGYYYYDGPRGFYAALEAFGGGGRGGGGGGGRRRNRPRRPRGEGSNGSAGAPTEEAPVASV